MFSPHVNSTLMKACILQYLFFGTSGLLCKKELQSELKDKKTIAKRVKKCKNQSQIQQGYWNSRSIIFKRVSILVVGKVDCTYRNGKSLISIDFSEVEMLKDIFMVKKWYRSNNNSSSVFNYVFPYIHVYNVYIYILKNT